MSTKPLITFKVARHDAVPVKRKPTENKSDILMGNLNSDQPRLRDRNGFVGAVTLAYNEHHHLILRPDDIWAAIMTQFSFYLEKYGEDLRSKFVDHKGQKELSVSANGRLHCAPYDEMARMISTQISKNIKDPSVKDWVMPNFSTTTFADQVVGAVILMATMKKYFAYKFSLMCGIPQVTLLGTVEDWKQIYAKAQRLVEFDKDGKMVDWSKLLLPVLEQFVQTAEGKPNREWWDRICCNLGSGSGPRYLSGWITVFCVFKDDGEWVGSTLSVKNHFKTEYTAACEFAPEGWPVINTNDLPPGVVNVDVLVDDNGTEYKCEMTAGHRSFNIVDKDGLQPRLEWDIHLKREKKERKPREPWEPADDEDD